jgi:ankyrin repeat/BTB/POZ domain-containing protein 2
LYHIPVTSAISVAAAHGQRATLHHMIAHHPVAVTKEVLSLEEILAEGASGQGCTVERHCERPGASTGSIAQQARLDAEGAFKFSKTQIKALQEAMYHSAENNHLGKCICKA